MSSSNSTKAALLDLRRRNRQPSPNFSLWASAKLPAGPLSRLRREPRFFPSALTAHSLKDRPALRYLAVSRREDWILIDRKSVVSGKRVSVRVDFGSCRIFKKIKDHANRSTYIRLLLDKIHKT